MPAKQPERFSVDRLETPIGAALIVTDADGVLRAFDWEDHVKRIRELLRLQYGAVELQEAHAPRAIRSALSGYFKGDLAALGTIAWRIAGTPFQQKVWNALPKIRAGTTMTYGALAAKLGAPNAMRGRTCQWLQSDQRRHSLPSPDRRQRRPDQVWQRARAQTLAAAARGRSGVILVVVPWRCVSIELRCAIAHLRISRFRVWSYGPSRNDKWRDFRPLKPRASPPRRRSTAGATARS
jgi:methylated-DNA-[protein]-cysteine S-methyltransferase